MLSRETLERQIASKEAEIAELQAQLAALPEIDPLLVEARRLVECAVHWSPQTDRDLQAGKNDNTPEVKIALAALRRGMELATLSRVPAAAWPDDDELERMKDASNHGNSYEAMDRLARRLKAHMTGGAA
jgi:hypothetical protein